MRQRHMYVVKPHASVIVLGEEPLVDGTEAQFTQIGVELSRPARG